MCKYELFFMRQEEHKLLNKMKKVVLAVMLACAVGFTYAEEKKTEKIVIKGDSKTVNVEKDSENTPIIVVDGKVFEGDLDDIKPETIESMTVLKNADAVKAYGEDASKKGVIVITLKKAE